MRGDQLNGSRQGFQCDWEASDESMSLEPAPFAETAEAISGLGLRIINGDLPCEVFDCAFEADEVATAGESINANKHPCEDDDVDEGSAKRWNPWPSRIVSTLVLQIVFPPPMMFSHNRSRYQRPQHP